LELRSPLSVAVSDRAWALKSAVEGIARNPESSGKVTVTMLIGLAMIESLCIYALVVSLILIYAHPQAAAIAGLFAS
jgi:F-type H+-transporting ATPase subunit c